MSAHKEHGLGFFFGILLALFALTLLTFFTARQWEASIPMPLHVPIALVIAGAKAFLVAWFFMHLGRHPATSRAYLVTAFVLLTLLITMVVSDVATRLPVSNPNFPAYGEKAGPW
jgi:caa(3)-type oxidase subunit IV